MRLSINSVCAQIFLIIISISCIPAAPKVTIQELTSGWTLRNQNRTIVKTGIRLPSGVYSALRDEYGDILQSENDDNLRWIAYDNWTYIAEFEVLDSTFTQIINLTLHGIDTVSTVRLNDKVIGRTENMFVRYSFNIRDAVREKNILEIEIQSPFWVAKQRAEEIDKNYPPKCPPEHVNGVCHRNMLRKMQSSFGADATLAALSMGIWKYITLEFYDTAIMRDVDIAVKKNETHWNMDIKVFLSSDKKRDFYGNMTFIAPGLFDKSIVFETRLIKYTSLMLDYKVEIPKDKVIEWWPNGYGEPKLYPLIFTMKFFEDVDSRFRSGWVTQKILNFGFRTIELVEDKDEYGRTFYFKVNGQPIFIKGAIYLPSHILPEEESHLSTSGQERIRYLMKSAKDANLNMIRIWGGGVYGSDLLYNYADMLGLLIWQDLPFSGATYPMTASFLHSVRHEVAQNSKRLAYHPSLAVIATNNEIELYLVKNRSDFGNDAERLEEDYKQLFLGIIKYELNTISRNEYNPRPGPLISTPSLGCEENAILPANPQDPNFGDVHFWPADGEDAWSPDVWVEARFISEFGFQSLPIRVSWNRTLETGDTILSLMQHRQHEVKRFKALTEVVQNHLPQLDWQEDIETFIYFSQVAQAMAVKTATEVFMSNRANYRTMGAIYWHLNDVWIAPTWSSIDYYGNYKLLYYWSKQFLAPITIIALKDKEHNAIKITIIFEGIKKDGVDYNDKEDPTNPKTFNVTINTYLWSTLYPQKTIVREEHMGDKMLKQFSLSMDKILVPPFTENNCFVEVILSQAGTIYASNIFFPGNIKDAVGVTDPQLTISVPKRATDDNDNNFYIFSYSFSIRIKSPALFVYIEIFHPEISKYELSHNGFMMMEPIRVVHLKFKHGVKELENKLTEQHIKVTTINQYMLGIEDYEPETSTSGSSTESYATESTET